MGCGIHLLVEKKENNVWKAVKGPKTEFGEIIEDINGLKEDSYYWLSCWQNYDCFAALCGVRNYSNVTPISEPKGFPIDADNITKKEYESWLPDVHRASWLSLNELMSVDWNLPVKKKYYLSKHQAEEKLRGKEPAFVKHTKNRDTDVLFEDEKKLSEFAYFIPKIIRALKSIGEPDQVRIVFWFDN